jgi:hypothetical protein
LRRELVVRGLRVKLGVIPLPVPQTPTPVDALDDASDAALCVLLMPAKSGGLGYIAIPAPKKRGQMPVSAEGAAGGGEIESGEVGEVAERVAEMVQRVTG